MSNENLMLTEDTLQKLRKELMVTRIITVISSILMLCILAGGFVVFHTVQGYVDTVQEYVEEVEAYAVKLEPAIDIIAGLDAQAVDDALEQMTAAFGEVDWKGLSESFEKVDWEQLAGKVEELDVDAINEAIGGLDTEELSTALENMNAAAQTIRDLADKLTFWN